MIRDAGYKYYWTELPLLYRKGHAMHITSFYARSFWGLKPRHGASQFERVDFGDGLGGDTLREIIRG